jgi:hypothetical protein
MSEKKAAKKTTSKKPVGKPAGKPIVKSVAKKVLAKKVSEKTPISKISAKTKSGKKSVMKSTISDSIEIMPENVDQAAETPKKGEKAKKALAKENSAKSAKTSDKAVPLSTGPMAQKWTSLFKKAEAIESQPYNMRATYEEKTAIVHKILGWGYILANRNDRLEVLFKDGIKYLISNYK